MLPKIIVADTQDRNTILLKMGLSSASVMGYEGSEGKIDDLRRFVNFGTNVSAGSTNISLVIWDADRLSPECQAVLLKPLEEATEKMCLLLFVSNENGLLPTILSRCTVSAGEIVETRDTELWKSVLDCFAKGPAKCLALADELDKPEMETTLNEVIVKLKSGLSLEVNRNRLKILKLAIDCLAKIKYTNVNPKLTFGNFLVSAWRYIKAPVR